MEHIDLKSLRYRIWLWLVRECELWRILMSEYNKIPSMTLTKTITWLLLKNRMCNRLFSMLEKRVRRKLSCINSVKTRSRREQKERQIIDNYFRTHPYFNRNDYVSS